ncbi:energy-coupling factor transporter transmembrane component T family protein [Bordetella bronchialis]|uniref:Cobalt ABC transporter n=1 Tax=Bordetella bronchialis TaxID=463025 RepID=A0ABN4R5S9_9BORD|nr:energy-coupling factor transporter transmembrane protein EcfT [Bordetella bronchialis]ANN68035.1 cobalt ABC transporter [Bordetella bronchialis]
MMEPLYVEGDGPLHRIPASWKLMALLAAGAGLFLVRRLDALGAAAAVGGLLVAMSGAGFAAVWRHARGLLPILAVVGAFTAYFDGWAQAAEVLLRVCALVALAMAVTLTTRTTDLIRVCERALYPLDRLGWVDASRVSLALALTLRFIPEIWRNYQDIREAQAARGLSRNALALAVPLLVRTLKRAEEVAEAIEARGG